MTMRRKSFVLLTVGLFFGLTVYYFYPESSFPENVTIDKIVILKSSRQLKAFSHGKLIKKYKISIGGNPIGQKEFEGDKKTPEGIYFIDEKNPKSGYHRNLGISYPNQADIRRAKKFGEKTGSDIKIHGIRNGFGFIGKFHRLCDWTLGCIAVTNSEIEELYDHSTIGTIIEIKP
jgi:murein L,D-transpeptidase YafK